MFQKFKRNDLIYMLEDDNVTDEWRELPPGLYNLFFTGGLFSRKMPSFEPIQSIHNLVEFSGGIIKDIIAKCDDFFSEKTTNIYKEMNMCQKMGILLHGDPGTGKTCTAMLAMQILVKKYGAICLDIADLARRNYLYFALDTVKSLRKTQKHPIILFLDEFDNYTKDGSDAENLLLTYLDGNNSIDKTVLIGCTNYIDKIPKRIKFRKSRIKHCFEIKALPIEVYAEYIKKTFDKMDSEEVFEFAVTAEEQALTLDQIKHAVIDHKVEGMSIQDAIQGVLIEE